MDREKFNRKYHYDEKPYRRFANCEHSYNHCTLFHCRKMNELNICNNDIVNENNICDLWE